MESKWMKFVETGDTGKTKIYNVTTKTQFPVIMGKVFWHYDLKCYAFSPAANTVFEKQALSDIVRFLTKLMQVWRQNRPVK